MKRPTKKTDLEGHPKLLANLLKSMSQKELSTLNGRIIKSLMNMSQDELTALRNRTIEGLENMSVAELTALKELWFDGGSKGEIGKCLRIAEALGSNTAGGRVHSFVAGDLEISVRNNQLRVLYMTKVVVDTDYQIFIPGEWIPKIDRLYEVVIIRELRRIREEEAAGKNNLTNYLKPPAKTI